MSDTGCPTSCSKGSSSGWAGGLWAGVGLGVIAGGAALLTGGTSLAMMAGMSSLQGFSTAISNPKGNNSYPEKACALYNQCILLNKNYEDLSVLMDKIRSSKTVADEDVNTINDMLTSFVDMNQQLQEEQAEFATRLSTFAIIMIVGTAFLSYYIINKHK